MIMKRKFVKWIALILLVAVAILTVQVRLICRGIVQFRFRPTNTAMCVSICDAMMHDGSQTYPIWFQDGVITKKGYRRPRFVFWQGELDETLEVSFLDFKPVPSAPPSQSGLTNILIEHFYP
jgi:hypothetical protein